MSASTTFFYVVVNGAPLNKTFRTKPAAIKHAQWIVGSATGQIVSIYHHDRTTRQDSEVKFQREVSR